MKPLYVAKAEFFRSLGHPARIRVLELLSERPYAVHELLEDTGLEPSNLSHQLAVLRRSGLIVQERRDGQVFYSLAAPEVAELLRSARIVLLDVLNENVELRHDLAAPLAGGAGAR